MPCESRAKAVRMPHDCLRGEMNGLKRPLLVMGTVPERQSRSTRLTELGNPNQETIQQSFFKATAMKSLTAALFTSFISLAMSAEPAPDAKAPVDPGVVVLELFTSEGCSSCPPTEKRLTEYVRSANGKGAPVHLIAYHVTFWDKLVHGEHGAWKDPFGDPKWTALLKDYSAIHPHPVGGMATPSVFANGIQMANKKFADVMQAELKRPVTATIEAKWMTNSTLSYTVACEDTSADLIVVLRESGLSSTITAGENHNKTLPHEYVARWRKKIALNGALSGSVEVAVPDGVVRTYADLILFVQNKSLGVYGAQVLALPTEKS
jgi:hypothetical protein